MPDSAPLPADLDLRLVRYFTVVADLGNFGRAAEQLRVAQPSLSRQIRRLEERVGARLLDRTSRGTHLTAAGEQFLPRARVLLRLAAQAAAAAREVAEPSRITIGLLPNTSARIAPALHDLRLQHPDAEIRTLDLAWNEARAALLDRRVDAVVTRLPITPEGLRITPLYQEPRVLVVPLSHHLAAKGSVALEEFADEPLINGPRIEALEDTLELIAAGEALAILPSGLSDARSDLAAIPIDDVEPAQVVLATRVTDDDPLVTHFREHAEALRYRHAV
jgi:DNA-binding transcriptional LysR family regulator